MATKRKRNPSATSCPDLDISPRKTRAQSKLEDTHSISTAPSAKVDHDEKHDIATKKPHLEYTDANDGGPTALPATPKGKGIAKHKQTPQTSEKRRRIFRTHAPKSFLDRLHRVMTQRMFLIDRNRTIHEDGTHQDEEIFDLAGTTGNIYQVKITQEPTCTCPDAKKGNQCKHIIYVLHNILKAPEHLVYQLAFLSEELRDIFADAPRTPQSSHDDDAADSTDTGGQRKPIEGDCPVCVMAFDVSDTGEEILWCKAACGNNIHKDCFEQWARSKLGTVKCVYCRTPWKGDEESLRKIKANGPRNEEGYVNVGNQLGLDPERDMSTYHRAWVAREFG